MTSFFNTTAPDILFVERKEAGAIMYFKDGDDFVRIEVTASRSWSSPTTVNTVVTRSATFDFEINPTAQFFVLPDKKLRNGVVEYCRGNISQVRGEEQTNLYAISKSSFGLSSKLKSIMHADLCKQLPKEVVDGLMANKNFAAVVQYEKEILAQL